MNKIKKFFLLTLLILFSATAVIVVSDQISVGVNILRGVSAQPTSIKVGDIIVSSPWVDVRYYGAKGDGVTDDYLAFYNAVNSFPAGQKGIVFVRYGDYKLTQFLAIPRYVGLIGQGSPEYYGSTLIFSPDNTVDGLVLSGDNILQNISVVKAVTGIKLNSASHCRIDNVNTSYCTLGLWLYNSIWNTISHFNALYCGTGGKLDGDTVGNYYTNGNVFVGAKFRYATGDGLVINRGKGNLFLGCTFENNGGNGLEIDNADPTLIPSYLIYSYGGNHEFNNCWWESNVGEAIYIKDDCGSGFNNCVIENNGVQTHGVVRITKGRNIRFKGGRLVDGEVTKKPFYLASTAINTEIDIDYLGQGTIIDYGIGTMFSRREIVRSKASEGILSNEVFGTLGGGGVDVFADWTEVNNDGATGGIITADATDLIRKTTISNYSCKFVMVALPTASMSIVQDVNINAPTETRYIVVEYKNDTGAQNINSPLSLYLYDVTNDKMYDFVNRTWPDNTIRVLDFPLSSVPTSISVPFVLPAGGLIALRVAIINYRTGADAGGTIHHSYSISLQTFKEPVDR